MAWRWTSDVKIRPNKGRNPSHWSHRNSSTSLSKKMETKSTDMMACGLRRRQDHTMILKHNPKMKSKIRCIGMWLISNYLQRRWTVQKYGGGGSSNVVGIICPSGWNRVNRPLSPESLIYKSTFNVPNYNRPNWLTEFWWALLKNSNVVCFSNHLKSRERIFKFFHRNSGQKTA